MLRPLPDHRMLPPGGPRWSFASTDSVWGVQWEATTDKERKKHWSSAPGLSGTWTETWATCLGLLNAFQSWEPLIRLLSDRGSEQSSPRSRNPMASGQNTRLSGDVHLVTHISYCNLWLCSNCAIMSRRFQWWSLVTHMCTLILIQSRSKQTHIVRRPYKHVKYILLYISLYHNDIYIYI